jgi:hypothetical protein
MAFLLDCYWRNQEVFISLFVILNVVKNLLRWHFYSIALAFSFLWYRCAKRHFLFGRQKESNQRKLPAAPASMSGSANCAGVVAEPDAGYGRITEGLCFCFLSNYHWRNEALFIFPLSF